MGAHRNSIYDKAYAEMYAKGMSLAETAKSIGVTRQCVYKAFKKRGFRLRTSIPCGFQIYDGKKFTLRSNGYYALTTDDRCLMHRYIWEKEICDIPDGWDVHHINGDKSDNRRDNLVCFPKAEHTRRHQDDRYLWPAMLDVIRTVRPRWVVGENVYGIVNWSEGLVFEQVCADLEAAGYEVQPYIIPACGVGAPHRRDRCWFVAHRTDAGTETMRERKDGIYAVELVAYPDGNRRRKRTNEQKPLPECVGTSDAGNGVENGIVAYPDRQRCEECNASGQSGHTQGRTTQEGDAKRRIPDWNGFPTQPPVCGGDDGFPGELAGIAFPRWRREAVKACGNAIVPQVALQIFETINEYEKI